MSSITTATRRFEFIGGSSCKYWEVTVCGPTVTVRFGRLGTAGQVQTKTCADATRADQHAASLVRQKLAKGYYEIGTPRAA